MSGADPAAPRPPLALRLGDVLDLRRDHPCGSRRWTVVRLGADIGLVCAGCGHRVLLERRVLERRLAAIVERGPEG
ncbi:MAG: DUF951 domain-containing protein [Chloroflexota bacterium]|nr:MAG: DUF951 domain-containing protein [Chloroflexota bacterium]